MTPLDTGAKRAILDACASLEAEATALLGRLVQFASTLGREGPCLDFVADAGLALNDSARHYFAGGLAFYVR